MVDNQQYEEAEQILQVTQLYYFVDNEEWRDTDIKSIVENEISNYDYKIQSLQRRWRGKRQGLLKHFHMSYRKKRKTEGRDSPSAVTSLSRLTLPPLSSPVHPPSFLPNYDPRTSSYSPHSLLSFHQGADSHPSSAQAHYDAVAYSMHAQNAEHSIFFSSRWFEV